MDEPRSMSPSRSPYAPHAITAPPTRPSREALRYPRRGGSQTEWLTETDVATAYRAGTSGLARVRAALVSDMAGHPTQHILDPDRPAIVPFRVDQLDPATGRPGDRRGSPRTPTPTPSPTPAFSWTTSPTSSAVSSKPPPHSPTNSCRPTAIPRPA
ncbi:hypothetical protein RKD18_000008 [Streptomyces phaeoluteigriseus]